jgi:hypothetical protein
MSFGRLTIPWFLPLVMGLALLNGACAAPLALTAASYAADGALLVASDKTATDHFVSMVSKKDCAMWRLLRGRPICKDREGDKDPYDVDYTQPQRMVAEDGVHYAPPLRAAPDAPAVSWDAAAYKTAPTPNPPPITAVADSPADPAPSTPSTTSKAKKAKAAKAGRSVKKPARDRVAPAS